MMFWPENIPQQLASLRLYRLRVTLMAQQPVTLPDYLGSTLRGALAMAFRRMVCTYGMRPCDGCPVQNRCHYPALFDTPNTTGDQKIRRMRNIPHPIVIEPPSYHPPRFHQGDLLPFEVVLIGNGIRFLPYLVYAINEMAESGLGKNRVPFRLVDVLDHQRRPIYSSETGILGGNGQSITLEHLMERFPHESSASLLFETPLRIKSKGALVSNQFDIHDFLKQICRRISAMMHFHESVELESMDFNSLLDQIQPPHVDHAEIRWFDWKRYSNQQKCKMKMGGIVGSVMLHNIKKEWWPILVVASQIHVGKGTIMGLGKIRIDNTT